MNADSFLANMEDIRPLPSLGDAGSLEPLRLAIGPGTRGLEVAVARAADKPTQEALRAAWAFRHGGRAAPVLLTGLYGDRAALCGPAGETPPVFHDLDIGEVERICRTALAEPSRHAASRFLWSILPEIKESQIPGLRNQGLFATHEREKRVPQRTDWPQAQQKSKKLLEKRGRDLLEGLGFQIAPPNQQYASIPSSRYGK